jgi:hypothetical protein
MKILDSKSFFDEYPQKMFYVGFMKSGDSWFPLCSVSDPEVIEKFDSLYVSLDYTVINELVQLVAKEAKGIEHTFVHYLLREEIQNIIETYALRNLVLAHDEGQSAGCGCGCGCGGDHSLGQDGCFH